jgi:hypothetical protein
MLRLDGTDCCKDQIQKYDGLVERRTGKEVHYATKQDRAHCPNEKTMFESSRGVLAQRSPDRTECSHQDKHEYEHEWKATQYSHSEEVIRDVCMRLTGMYAGRHPMARIVRACQPPLIEMLDG